MSSGANQTLFIGEETTRNVPATSFHEIAFTSNSMGTTPQKTESTAITPSRLSNGTAITGFDHAGTIEVEAQYTPALKMLLAGAGFNSWAGGKLNLGGRVKKTYTIIAKYGFQDAAPVYKMWTGCVVNGLNMDVAMGSIVKIGFDFMAMDKRERNSDPESTTPAPSTKDYPLMTSVAVGDIKINGNSMMGTACVSAFTLSLNNNIQEQPCLGAGTAKGNLIEGEAQITGTFTLAWSNTASQLYEGQFKNETISIEFPINDSYEVDAQTNARTPNGNGFVFDFAEVEYTAPLPQGGKNDILTSQFSYTAVRTAVEVEDIVKAVVPPEGG